MPARRHSRARNAGHRLQGAWGCAALLTLLATPAQAAYGEGAGELPQPRLEMESLPYAMQARAASGGARPLFETPSDGLRTRMWWGRGALEVGAGANVNPSSAVPGLATAASVGTAVVGLRAQVAQGTHLAIERDTLATSVAAGAAAPVEGSRVALEFKAVGNSKAAQPLSSGLLRVQMSGNSSLQFKPRSGGLAVSYRAKF